MTNITKVLWWNLGIGEQFPCIIVWGGGPDGMGLPIEEKPAKIQKSWGFDLAIKYNPPLGKC